MPNIFLILLLFFSVISQASSDSYPVWISPELGVKSLAPVDIDAALNRKFWDNPNYVRNYPKEVAYLKENQNKKDMPNSCFAISELKDKELISDDGLLWYISELKDGNNSFAVQETFEKKKGLDWYINSAPKKFSLFLDDVQSDCQAIQLLKKIKPAQTDSIDSFNFKQKIEDFLPETMLPSYQVCRGNYSPSDPIDDTSDRSWAYAWKMEKDLDGESIPTHFEKIFATENEAKIVISWKTPKKYEPVNEDNIFSQDLKILAKGNLAGSNKQQLLIKVKTYSDNFKDFAYSALYILEHQKNNPVLQLSEISNHYFAMHYSNYVSAYGEAEICDGKLYRMTEK